MTRRTDFTSKNRRGKEPCTDSSVRELTRLFFDSGQLNRCRKELFVITDNWADWAPVLIVGSVKLTFLELILKLLLTHLIHLPRNAVITIGKKLINY